MPPLTLEDAAALVPGGVTPAAAEKERTTMQQPQATALQPKTLKVKVLRAFYYQGKPVEKDATVELPRLFALEMKAAHKVAIVEEAEKPAAPPASGEKKGERHAR